MNIHEKFIGCFHMLISNTDSLSKKIIDTILDNKLDLLNHVVQCYDGANVMSGIHKNEYVMLYHMPFIFTIMHIS